VCVVYTVCPGVQLAAKVSGQNWSRAPGKSHFKLADLSADKAGSGVYKGRSKSS